MKVKKIAALVVGAAMVGATMGFASAVHWIPSEDQMPAKDFFVKNGQPNVKIVVGSQGAAQDVVAAADIAVALGTMVYNEKEVEVSGPAVFKELPHAVGEIPVYASPRLTADSKTEFNTLAANYWWNGDYITTGSCPGGCHTYPAYNATKDEYRGYWHTTLSPFEKILNENVDNWMEELDNTDYNADVTVDIQNITIVDPDDKPYPTGDELIQITPGNFTYTVDYLQGHWTYKVGGGECCEPKYKYDWHFIIDDPGIQPGDSFTLLGEKYHAICVYGNYTAGLDLATICPTCVAIGARKYVLLLATDVIEGQKGWVTVGGTLSVGGANHDEYTINVLDINIVGTEKVLLKVVDNTGVRPTATVSIEQGKALSIWGDYDGDGDDDLVIVLHSTFIGVNGNTQARLLVYTDLRAVNDGDLWPSSEWEVHFFGLVNNVSAGGWSEPDIPGGGWNSSGIIDINSCPSCAKAVEMIKLVNAKKIGPAKTISVPSFNPVYNLTYKASVCGPMYCEDDDYWVYKGYAWIEIDKVGNLATWSLEKGDTLYDVDMSGGEDYIQLADLGKVSTIEPGKVSSPITLLDEEVMAAGLDQVGSNLILVGGPVVNSVTAALADKLGVPSDYDGWESEYGTGADSGVIAYKAECPTIGGYGVLLVAGTDREGTMAAAEALMEYLNNL